MKDQKEVLIKLGLSEQLASDFILNIALKSYKQGVKDYCKSPKTLQAFLREDVKEFKKLLL